MRISRVRRPPRNLPLAVFGGTTAALTPSRNCVTRRSLGPPTNPTRQRGNPSARLTGRSPYQPDAPARAAAGRPGRLFRRISPPWVAEPELRDPRFAVSLPTRRASEGICLPGLREDLPTNPTRKRGNPSARLTRRSPYQPDAPASAAAGRPGRLDQTHPERLPLTGHLRPAPATGTPAEAGPPA